MLFAERSTQGLDFAGAPVTSTLITFLLGLGIVFVGLIALIVIIKIMGAIMKNINNKKAKAMPAAEEQPVGVPEPEGDRGEIIAAVSAAIATVMGENVSGIRIVSFKKAE